ncbi:MAG: tRNA uridine-5-carboxymethylaminomethyl(34) synthesis GTPase MnmE [Pseudomonadota bacterium]
MQKRHKRVLQKPDTIAAIATAPGQGGIGVVRVSGPEASRLAVGLTGLQLKPRFATYTSFLDQNGTSLDQGIALYFSAPNSFTGEDVLELQGHGGIAVLQAVLQRCLQLGARLASPGEFTQRAFINGKIDLAQAESIADLISATTQQAARSAVRSMSGDFSRSIERMVRKIIELRAFVEATLDFPEEEGVVVVDERCLAKQLVAIRTDLQHISSLAKQGNILREGAQVVLLGAPNAGKSSLLNLLAGEEVALVSDIPGTTRDTLRQVLQIDGVPLHLIDTAGIRETDDILEQMGIARTRRSLEQADVVILLVDESNPVHIDYHALMDGAPRSVLIAHNKIDLASKPAGVRNEDGVDHIFLSVKTGDGVTDLKKSILAAVGWHREEGVFMARARHLDAIGQAIYHLSDAEQHIAQLELFAESLRLAQNSLNQITGEFVPDDLLGEIFGKFCIGK